MTKDLIDNLMDTLLSPLGLGEGTVMFLSTVVMAFVAVSVAGGVSWLVYSPVNRQVQRIVGRTSTDWDDRLLSPSVMKRVSWLVFFIVLLGGSDFMLAYYPQHLPLLEKILRLSVLAGACVLVYHLINIIYDGLREEQVDMHGISIIRNTATAVLIGIGFIMALSIIMSKNIAYVVSALGAAAAVLSLVFKDSILGIIAGIRLTFNKMICHDDWISVPAYNANGRVEDVTINSVRVRNWDNSVTSVPPAALLNTGFQNMQEMLRQGSRQIRRAYNVDVNTVRLLQPGELEAFAGQPWAEGFDLSLPQVNLSLWRAWLRHAIETHPSYQPRPRSFVRELPVTPEGIPVEVHFFVDCLQWPEFEELQADFTDRILASVAPFSLSLYQRPAGRDLRPLPA